MHRVYNSAFMNILKREENANYRQVIKNILEYNPQILKRFVNFLNNPDEETAIAQFGKDDKYFGVCLMMCTMPGLPMFGHGQIEGLTEKYGMEYGRAYRDEQADENLVERHEREVFPLLRRRYLFSEMDNFILYDFFASTGFVNEDVFAFSNGAGDERVLVVYNNRYSDAAGWVKNSVSFRGGDGKMVQRTLADGLALKGGKTAYCVFKDAISGMEYIRNARALKNEGFYAELGAYKYFVFADFREVESTSDSPYAGVCERLNGRPVLSVDAELHLYKLRDVHEALYEALNSGSLMYLLNAGKDRIALKNRVKAFQEKSDRILLAVRQYEHGLPEDIPASSDRSGLFTLLALLARTPEEGGDGYYQSRLISSAEDGSLPVWRTAMVWLFVYGFDRIARWKSRSAGDLYRDWMISEVVRKCFAELGVSDGLAKYESRIIEVILEVPRLISKAVPEGFDDLVEKLMHLESGIELLGVHEYDGIRWFNKERFEDLLLNVALIYYLFGVSQTTEADSEPVQRKIFDEIAHRSTSLVRIAARSKYKFDDFMLQLDYRRLGLEAERA